MQTKIRKIKTGCNNLSQQTTNNLMAKNLQELRGKFKLRNRYNLYFNYN